MAVMNMMRLAIKFSYDGSSFHGSQIQNGSPHTTVEGRIVDALRRIGAIPEEGDPPLWISSRTDAGVSALGNVMALDTSMDRSDLLCALNANLDDIWCLGSAVMRDHQNVRWADSRWYRYHMVPGILDPAIIPGLDRALGLYIGDHDFVHLSRRDGDRDTNVRIETSRSMDLGGGLVAIDIVGSRFLWNQVRRMVGGAIQIVNGDITMEEMSSILKGGALGRALKAKKDRIPTMPAAGLVLMDVTYKDLEFVPDPRALDIALERSSEAMFRAMMGVILGSALRSMRRSV